MRSGTLGTASSWQQKRPPHCSKPRVLELDSLGHLPGACRGSARGVNGDWLTIRPGQQPCDMRGRDRTGGTLRPSPLNRSSGKAQTRSLFTGNHPPDITVGRQNPPGKVLGYNERKSGPESRGALTSNHPENKSLSTYPLVWMLEG